MQRLADWIVGGFYIGDRLMCFSVWAVIKPLAPGKCSIGPGQTVNLPRANGE